MLKTQMEGQEGSNPSLNDTFEAVLRRRVSRRGFLKGALAGAPLLVVGPSLLGQGQEVVGEGELPLMFQPIGLSDEDRIVVSPGYSSKVLIRWGDPLHPDVPEYMVRRHLQSGWPNFVCQYPGGYPHWRSRQSWLHFRHLGAVGGWCFVGRLLSRTEPRAGLS